MQPCQVCRRHVRGAECPFCGSRTEPSDVLARTGRLSRAMVFAGAALAVGACAHKQKHDTIDERDMGGEQHHGGGGCMPPDQAKIDELEKRKADSKDDEEKRNIDDELQRARQPVCMPYGAPPRRARVV